MRNPRILSVFWHNVESDSASLSRANPSAGLFREQIEFLIRNYTPISISDFLKVREEKHLIHFYRKPPILLAFDDGFKNVIRYALPILEEFNVPAVFFVIGEIVRNADFVPWYVERKHLIRKTAKKNIVYGDTTINLDTPEDVFRLMRLFDASFRRCRSEAERQTLLDNFAEILDVDRPRGRDLDDDLKFVDVKDLGNLSSESRLTVASHAMSHRDLATLSYEQQVAELEESHSLLRQSCSSYYPVIAYPNGSFTKETIDIARRIYKAGFAVLLGSSHRNLYAYPRVGIDYSSARELEYILTPKRLNYLLPLKRLLHATGIRPL
jgi:peptidoglycan/xylan/chitin deacetylase (PgdA/CDA1 family)